MKITVASNAFPEFVVYDSTKPPSALGKFLKFGFKVETDEGLVLLKSDQPKVSKAVQWGVFGVSVALVGFIFFKAIK